jgi:hypothetical protein
LAHGVEPALDVVGFTVDFTHQLMAVRRKDALVSLPEIAERVAARIGARDASPEVRATDFTAVADEAGDNLPRAVATRLPGPNAGWLS